MAKKISSLDVIRAGVRRVT